MQLVSIAIATCLATMAIAAPTPLDNIDINGLVGVDAVVPRDAVPEEDLTVDAAGLFVHGRRDLVSDLQDEASKLSDVATALVEGASKRDLVSETEGKLSKS